MNLEEYVLTKINIDVLKQILNIDNSVEKTNLQVEEVLTLIKNYKKFDPINVKFSIVCDGELENTINLLMNYRSNINYIYVNHHYMGIYIYLLSILNDIDENIIQIEENNLNKNRLLDNIVISGSRDFTLDYKERLNNKNIIIYN